MAALYSLRCADVENLQWLPAVEPLGELFGCDLR